jgi:hypothetical protein
LLWAVRPQLWALLLPVLEPLLVRLLLQGIERALQGQPLSSRQWAEPVVVDLEGCLQHTSKHAAHT